MVLMVLEVILVVLGVVLVVLGVVLVVLGGSRLSFLMKRFLLKGLGVYKDLMSSFEPEEELWICCQGAPGKDFRKALATSQGLQEPRTTV